MDFAVPVDHRLGIKTKRNKTKVLCHCQKTEKVMEQYGNGDTNCNWNTRNGSQRLGKKAERIRIGGRIETF